ncbi:S8 family serine peptidase [Flavobacterium sp. SUN052]|uniref:S8 family serine peptidase n=1 Tax=Flavobacterium sp. SUN052 TaxID=3002441 RepID=UPI00237E4DED|nr:S8 family serine peptidase [Flavobacterium sp. SUN052]MEC4005345.1 S8 family serine peptidase [Flavobacterium sp. SUN052]
MKNLLLIFLFTISFCGYSQEDAWVYFKDKPNAQSYLDNPLTMLTQRALDRRTAQGIPLNVNDTPIEQSYIDQITAASGIEIKAKSKWLNCLHIRGSQTDINALLSLSFVNYVHFADNNLNSKMAVQNQFASVNKQLDVQTTFNYGNSNNQIEMLNGHLLHQANYTGGGKIIAVLDSGFTGVSTIIPFNRMFNNGLYLGGYNYVARNTDVFSTHNHGTMTLSCMVGYVDGQLVGTAPDAAYYLFITEDVSGENPVEESNWVEAAEEADRLGVDIISTSLGYFDYDNPNYSHSYSDMTGNSAFASQGANIAFSKGMIVVASAGNSGSSSEPHIGVPAEATNVLAVGAVKFDRTYAAFSSIGPSFDGRIKPDVMAKGQSTTLSNTTGTITTASGTSFSCPVMAGMIASFWQAVPSLTNQQVVDFVKQSSDRFSNPNAQYGYGIPDFQIALDNVLLANNQSQKSSFVIFPNPSQNQIAIRFSNSFSNVTLVVYNNLGQLVFKNNDVQSDDSINLEAINSGVYFYKITSDNVIQTGKIIKE